MSEKQMQEWDEAFENMDDEAREQMLDMAKLYATRWPRLHPKMRLVTNNVVALVAPLLRAPSR